MGKGFEKRGTDVKNKDLLSIKEFSEFSGIPASTLRYYDDSGLFHPALRGENGYRYYSPQQLTTLNFVHVLSNLKVSLKTIKEAQRSRTPESIAMLLSRQEQLLDTQIRLAQDAHAVIHTFLRLLNEGMNAREDEIYVAEEPAMSFVLGDVNDFRDDDYFYATFARFCASADRLRINLNYPVGGYFQDMAAYQAQPSRPTRFFSADPFGRESKPAGKYLVGFVRGYYGNTGDLPRRMKEYAEEHGLVFSGAVYNLFLQDEISVRDPDQYLQKVSAGLQFGRGGCV